MNPYRFTSKFEPSDIYLSQRLSNFSISRTHKSFIYCLQAPIVVLTEELQESIVL